MNYFVVERGGRCWENVILQNTDGNVVFENYLGTTYDEMKAQEDLDSFVVAVMDATNAVSDNSDEQTIITLVGEDDIFVWSVIMGAGADDNIMYSLVDWKKDGKNYRYAPENGA